MSNVIRGRNVINILLLSLLFIIIFFAFIVLVFLPAGKTYKKEHKIYKKQMYELHLSEDKHDETMEQLKDLQAKNRNIILGYENLFDLYLFHQHYDRFFKSLTLSKPVEKGRRDIFTVYEFAADAVLTSPASFYEFLEEINKGDNIVHVQFPIKFDANNGLVKAQFTMEVLVSDFEKYLKSRDVNATKEQEGAKL